MRNKIKDMLSILYIIMSMLFFCTYGFSDDIDDEAANAVQILHEKYSWVILREPEKYKGIIKYIEKVNMGIPGGDNWLVVWDRGEGRNGSIECSVIAGEDEVISRSICSNSDMTSYTWLDMTKYIPGKRIGTSSCVVGDFNNDGVDEVFNFLLGGNGNYLEILGYDIHKDKFVSLFQGQSRFSYPTPVEFMEYKGMYGFKALNYVVSEVWPPSNLPPDPKEGWFFYTWDEEQRKYIEVERTKTAAPVAELLPEEEQVEETSSEKERADIQFGHKTALIIGIITVVFAVILFAVRKRRKMCA